MGPFNLFFTATPMLLLLAVKWAFVHMPIRLVDCRLFSNKKGIVLAFSNSIKKNL